MSDQLINAVAELEEEKALNIVQEMIDNGYTPLEIVEYCKKGVEIVGEKYSNQKYFLSDLIMSEEILKEIMEIMEPHFPDNTNNSPKEIDIVMGTIEGDIHDLGKNIVIYLLKSVGINVLDLGVDVSPEEFLKKVSETNAKILGISVLLTYSIGSVKKVIELIEEADMREDIKIIIGGYPVNSFIKKYTGADYYNTSADEAVDMIRSLLNK
ncbi:MAG TPA: cobalamin-dependent protein [Halanaerobiales bacterium]|nr:cobalamin-dependent protein [Halanaerobiales bacterium]